MRPALGTGIACVLAILAATGSVEAQGRAPRFELRVNTGMPAIGFGEIIDTAPGVFYQFDDDVLIINLDLGVGVMVVRDLFIGATGTVLINEDTDTSDTIYTLRAGPYVKYAMGSSHRESGLFLEGYFTAGVTHFDRLDDFFTFNFGAWAGWQAFVGDSAAITVGPYVEHVVLEDDDSAVFTFGSDNFTSAGLRFGLSVFP